MKKASEITISALRRCSPKLANAASISCSVLAFMIRRQAEGLGCGLHVLRFVRSFRIGRVDEIAGRADVRHELAQRAQPFRSQHVAEKGYARDIAAGSIEGGDETRLDRVSANREDDRNDRGLPCFGYGLSLKQHSVLYWGLTFASLVARRQRKQSSGNWFIYRSDRLL